jgi:hypothetical protein
MVVRRKLVNRRAQVPFADRNDVIQALLHGPDEALRIRVTVRRGTGYGAHGPVDLQREWPQLNSACKSQQRNRRFIDFPRQVVAIAIRHTDGGVAGQLVEDGTNELQLEADGNDQFEIKDVFCFFGQSV